LKFPLLNLLLRHWCNGIQKIQIWQDLHVQQIYAFIYQEQGDRQMANGEQLITVGISQL